MELKKNGQIDGKCEVKQIPQDLNDFDDILEVVGSYGKYQKKLLYGLLAPLCVLAPYFFSNRIFMLSVPDHWCHVPGRPNDTDLETWKNLTLPRELKSNGLEQFSQCERWGENDTKVKCDAWEFDKSNYDRTLPSEFDWVCDHEARVANVFSTAGAGATVGTIALGIAVDKFGRKSTYYSTLVCFVIFALTTLFVPGNYTVFLIVQFFMGVSICLIYVAPSMIIMELLGREHRASVYAITAVCYVLGNSLLPLFAYLMRSWFLLGITTPATAAVLFIYYKTLPESPRWLLSMGRADEALEIVREIARVNNKTFDDLQVSQAMKAIAVKDEHSRTKTRFWHLFSRKTLAIRTILLGIGYTINGVIYGGLLLNVTNMAGNEFLNYFLLAIIELPVGWAAGFLANKFGRRWTKTVLFAITGAIYFAAVNFVSTVSWVPVAAAVSGNLALSINAIIVDLQGNEVFPTELRSTGTSLAATFSSIIGFSVPYIVLLGKTHEKIPFIIYIALSILGVITSPLLSETKGSKLPETVEDADKFGRDHKFWSYLPNKNITEKCKNNAIS